MNRLLIPAVVGTALLVCAPLSLAAQQPPMAHDEHNRMGHGEQKLCDMSQMEEMMVPMKRAMTFSPDHLLARKDSLNLTSQQVTRLTALVDARKKAHDAAHGEARTHLNVMGRTLSGAVADTNLVKLHFQAAQSAMGAVHWAMLTAATQARAVLTDEQRARVERWASSVKEHGQHH